MQFLMEFVVCESKYEHPPTSRVNSEIFSIIPPTSFTNYIKKNNFEMFCI